MSNFFETRSYWHGGFTEDQQEYYKEYCLSQKGIHLWRLIDEGVTPRLLLMGLPGVPEDRRPMEAIAWTRLGLLDGTDVESPRLTRKDQGLAVQARVILPVIVD